MEGLGAMDQMFGKLVRMSVSAFQEGGSVPLVPESGWVLGRTNIAEVMPCQLPCTGLKRSTASVPSLEHSC